MEKKLFLSQQLENYLTIQIRNFILDQKNKTMEKQMEKYYMYLFQQEK